jgi:tetratricopeptide (TPR) repeat protein
MGNHAKAADAYEKALALGASPASTNQRLAQCYVKLNRKADAIKAYERAITAFERMDQNDIRVQAMLDACRAELKDLRGN